MPSRESKTIAIILGQFISQVGNSVSGFALGLWLFLQTKEVMSLSFVYLFQLLPGLIFIIPAGIIVDKFHKKNIIILTDLISIFFMVLLVIEFSNNRIFSYEIYLYNSIFSILNVIQALALTSLISGFIKAKKQPMFNVLLDSRKYIPRLIGPLLSVFLLTKGSIISVLIADISSFLISIIITISFCENKEINPVSKKIHDRINTLLLLNKIIKSPLLLYTLLCLIFSVLSLSLLGVYIIPLSLSISSKNISSQIIAIGGFGSLIGSIIYGFIYKHFNDLKQFVPLSLVLQGIFLLLMSINNSINVYFVTMFLYFLVIPAQNASSYSLWQRHIESEFCGRLFSIKGFFLQFASIIVFIFSGILEDKVLGPIMKTCNFSKYSNIIMHIFGCGFSRGMSFAIFICSISIIIVGIFSYIRLENIHRSIVK